MRILFVCFTLFLLVNPMNRASANDQAPCRDKAELVRLLNSGTLRRCEIIYLPEDVLTRTRLTAEMLEKQCFYRIIVNDLQSAPIRARLIAAIDSSTFEHAEEETDLRWGCIFSDEKNDRVLALYFNSTGRLGMVDHEMVISNGNLVKLLKKVCAGIVSK